MIEPEARRALEALLAERVRFDVPLARLTSLRVGGPADAVATPADRAELAALLGLCAHRGLPYQLIGAGFNTLALDEGLPGVVIQLGRFRRIEHAEDGALFVEAGVSHAQVARFCITHGLAGLEFAAGIPGTVGGWIAMNAGIPDREMKDVVEAVEVIAPGAAEAQRLPSAALRFAYRALHGLPAGSVIVSARLRVTRSERAAVEAAVEQLLARRSATQPLNVPSCGSVFKNPPGDFAGRLIEHCGLKGHRVGGAQISPIHANFIANTGGASAADVLALIEHAQARVLACSGIRLEREVRIVGGRTT